MPRYFFHVHDGAAWLDAEGTELPSLETAREEAIRALGEMIRDIPPAISKGEQFQLWVTDQPRGEGSKLFVLTVAAESG
jgi:hypothetical protein